MKHSLSRRWSWLLTVGMVFAVTACTEEEKEKDPVMAAGEGGTQMMGAGGTPAPTGGTPEAMGGTPASGGMAMAGGVMMPDPDPDPDPEPAQCVANQFMDNGILLGQGDTLIYLAKKEDAGVSDLLIVELHGERGFSMMPGTYDLADFSADGATCEVCVFAIKDRNFETGSRGPLMFARSGTLEITALSQGEEGQFAATLSNVRMEEARLTRIDDVLNFEWTADGMAWCVEATTLSAATPPAAARLGDPMPAFQLQNCQTEEFVDMHDLVADTQALWIVGTAGWCSACARFIPGEVLPFLERTPTEQVKGIFVVGENPAQGMPRLSYCRRYARGYGEEDASRWYIDHNGFRSFPTLFGNLFVYSDESGRFGLPWNAVVEGGDNPIYRYADGSNQDESLLEILTALTAE